MLPCWPFPEFRPEFRKVHTTQVPTKKKNEKFTPLKKENAVIHVKKISPDRARLHRQVFSRVITFSLDDFYLFVICRCSSLSPCAGAQAGTILGLFLNCGILEGNSTYFKLALKKINPDKLAWVRTCLDIVEKTGMIDISDDYSITVKNASEEFVQQVEEIYKIFN